MSARVAAGGVATVQTVKSAQAWCVKQRAAANGTKLHTGILFDLHKDAVGSQRDTTTQS